MDNVVKAIKKIIEQKPNAIIAIDGKCASGKTTLAAKLADIIGAQVIHMDDFFLPYDLRSDERLAQPGGNVHYERFTAEVAENISQHNFEYRVFSCSKGGYIGSKAVNKNNNPIIIEGAYSVHPKIPDIYDLKVFLDIKSETQLNRIEKRNGKEALEVFKSKWIPLENIYFESYNIKSKCDIVITNE